MLPPHARIHPQELIVIAEILSIVASATLVQRINSAMPSISRGIRPGAGKCLGNCPDCICVECCPGKA